MLAGSVCYSGHSGKASPLLHQYFAIELCADNVTGVFMESLSVSLIVLSVCFISGLCTVGQPVVLMIPLYRGFGMGLSASFVYAEKGIHALSEILLILVPEALSVSALAYLSVREALRMSNALMKYAARGESSDGSVLKLYCIRFGVLMLMSVIMTLAKVLLLYLFSGIV